MGIIKTRRRDPATRVPASPRSVSASPGRRAPIAAAALIAAALLIGGCSGAGTSATTMADSAASGGSDDVAFDSSGDMAFGSDADSAGGEMAEGPSQGPGAGSAPSSAAAADRAVAEAPAAPLPGGTPGGSGTLPTDRQIIRTAEFTVTVEVAPSEDDADETSIVPTDQELTDAANDAARAVRALVTLPGGYVAGSDGYGQKVTVTLRIPAGSYDAVVDRLSDIGRITSRAESTNDVTGEMVDVDSRIASQQASVDRLRALMADAQNMKDVIALESELSRREADLEALQRRQLTLADQVALSTISVTVEAVPATALEAKQKPAEEHHPFVAGVIVGWHGVSAVARVLAAALGGMLPFLPIVALIGAAWWFVARRRRLPAAAAEDALEVRPNVDQIDEHGDDGR